MKLPPVDVRVFQPRGPREDDVAELDIELIDFDDGTFWIYLMPSGRRYTRPRATCSVCGQEGRIRTDGTMHAHGPRMSTLPATEKARCPGSHQPPKETP